MNNTGIARSDEKQMGADTAARHAMSADRIRKKTCLVSKPEWFGTISYTADYINYWLTQTNHHSQIPQTFTILSKRLHFGEILARIHHGFYL